jgi:prevent-host-death family protein
LCDVIERARTEGPQTIMSHGTACPVVLSVEDYDALTTADGFAVARSPDTGRDVEI